MSSIKPILQATGAATILAFLLAAGCAKQEEPAAAQTVAQCPVSLIVLGVAQDGGKPQIGHPEDPAWADPSLRRLTVSLAVVDRRGPTLKRWMIEATPDMKEELERLDKTAPVKNSIALDGIFITHAHIGHYTGLMLLGYESAGAHNIPVYVMPRMADFLTKNGPWSQLVKYENIYLAIMKAGQAEKIAPGLSVTPFLVPHRQEFSEVVGFRIEGPSKSVIFIPDIDSWEKWDSEGTHIEDVIASADVAYLDGTFYANGEIPGRDMTGFPHPFVTHSMERFASLPDSEKKKIRFIHLNHTNPLNDPYAPQRGVVRRAGFSIAKAGEEVCLDEKR